MIWASLLHELETTDAVALVSLVRVFGSTPREAGVRMIVTADRLIGTIGGGMLEWQVIAEARRRLAAADTDPQAVIRIQALGPDLGQCCGGRVEIVTEVFRRNDRATLQSLAQAEAAGRFAMTGRILAPDFTEYFGERRGKLYLFGAGHVGHAVILALQPLIETSLTGSALPLDVIWVDSRPEFFDTTVPSSVTCRQMGDPVTLVPSIEPGSFVLIMTHSHALDYDLTAACLQQPGLSYIGLIGSATKRARFLRRFRDDGILPAQLDRLTCPIGLAAIRSKHPAAIAAAVVAELLVKAEELQLAQDVPNLPVAAGSRVERLSDSRNSRPRPAASVTTSESKFKGKAG